jgi:phytoene synthase
MQRLETWRASTHAAIAGNTAGHPIWPAFCDMVGRFGIPAKVFDDAIDGQIQDLKQDRYGTFAELYDYCYRVASTVGIAAVHIWGFTDRGALKLAEELGIAMQLTNILRDLREDAARGRRYLPDEDCQRFGVDGWMANGSAAPAGVLPLLQFEAERAAGYYQRSAPLEGMIGATARPTLRIMTGIYRGILDRIIASPQMVLSRRVSLSGMRKLWLVARHSWLSRLQRGG